MKEKKKKDQKLSTHYPYEKNTRKPHVNELTGEVGRRMALTICTCSETEGGQESRPPLLRGEKKRGGWRYRAGSKKKGRNVVAQVFG